MRVGVCESVINYFPASYTLRRQSVILLFAFHVPSQHITRQTELNHFCLTHPKRGRFLDSMLKTESSSSADCILKLQVHFVLTCMCATIVERLCSSHVNEIIRKLKLLTFLDRHRTRNSRYLDSLPRFYP